MLGWVALGWVSDAHAQKVIDCGIIIPPHEFKQLHAGITDSTNLKIMSFQ
jgi:hypothetical protein